VFIYSIEGFYANIFYSFEKIRYLVLREFITQSLRILALFSIVLFLPVRVRITAVFISFLLIVFLTFIINIYNLRKIISEKYKDENQKIDKLGVKRFIFFFSLASICLVLFSNMDAIILGLFVSPEYVGYYKAALSLILGLIGLLAFPNMFLLSVFSKVSKKNLEKILGAVFRYMSLFAIPITLGVVVLARYFIRIIYGYEYLNSVLPLCILAPIILPAIIVNLIVFVFTALEKPKLFAKIISYTALLNIILNFLLIGILNMASPIYAMVGASIACLLSWLFYFFRSYGLLKKEFKIYLDFKNILKPIIAGTFMCAFILTLSKIIGDMNLYTGIFVLISAIFSYFLVLFLISGLTKLDLEFFYKIIKPSKKK
jgi:O-antigen/teichoic acid export membrane protein